MSDQLEMWTSEKPVEEISLADMDNAIGKLRLAKDYYAEVSKTSKDAYAQVKEAEERVLSLMERAGKERYIAEGIGQVSISKTLSVATPKTPEQKSAFFNWLKKEMGEDGYLTYASVNSASLNSLYKQKVEEYGQRGEVLEIEGLEARTSFNKLSLRKA